MGELDHSRVFGDGWLRWPLSSLVHLYTVDKHISTVELTVV
jgi:hypothetical protein